MINEDKKIHILRTFFFMSREDYQCFYMKSPLYNVYLNYLTFTFNTLVVLKPQSYSDNCNIIFK